MTTSQQPGMPPTAEGLPDHQPDWFKTAVFYEVMIRSFSDSTGVGSGDLAEPTQVPGVVARRQVDQRLSGAVADLAVTGTGSSHAVLAWTATGDRDRVLVVVPAHAVDGLVGGKIHHEQCE